MEFLKTTVGYNSGLINDRFALSGLLFGKSVMATEAVPGQMLGRTHLEPPIESVIKTS